MPLPPGPVWTTLLNSAYLAPGARAAGQRRHLTLQLEERRRREAQAYRLARAAHGLRRAGPFLTHKELFGLI